MGITLSKWSFSNGIRILNDRQKKEMIVSYSLFTKFKRWFFKKNIEIVELSSYKKESLDRINKNIYSIIEFTTSKSEKYRVFIYFTRAVNMQYVESYLLKNDGSTVQVSLDIKELALAIADYNFLQSKEIKII